MQCNNKWQNENEPRLRLNSL